MFVQTSSSRTRIIRTYARRCVVARRERPCSHAQHRREGYLPSSSIAATQTGKHACFSAMSRGKPYIMRCVAMIVHPSAKCSCGVLPDFLQQQPLPTRMLVDEVADVVYESGHNHQPTFLCLPLDYHILSVSHAKTKSTQVCTHRSPS